MSLTSNRKDSVAVVGVGTTKWGAMPEHDATSLGIWALRDAAEDAGIDLHDIDGLICQRITDYQKFVQITNISLCGKIRNITTSSIWTFSRRNFFC